MLNITQWAGNLRPARLVTLTTILVLFAAGSAAAQDSGDGLPDFQDQPLQTVDFEEDHMGDTFSWEFKSGMAEIGANGEVDFRLAEVEVEGNPLEMDSPYMGETVLDFSVPAEEGTYREVDIIFLEAGAGFGEGATIQTKVEVTAIDTEEDTISGRMAAVFDDPGFTGNLIGDFTVPYLDNR